MNEEIARLLKVQSLDGRIGRLAKELESRPGIVEAQDFRVIQINERREKLKLAVKACKIEIDKADLDIKSNDADIANQRGKINQIKTNVEFNALNKQIARIEEEKGEVEEKILELWDDIESLQSGLTSTEEELKEAREVLAEESKEIEAELTEIRNEIETLQSARSEAADSVDAEAMADYTRLASRYGAHAIVSSENMICAGCQMSLSPQIMNLLRDVAKIVVCTHCARILYSPG